MEWVAVLLLLVLGVAMAPAKLAGRFGHRPHVVASVFVLQLIGLFALGYGLMAVMFNGYVEDYGMEPANTTNQAIVGLVIGAVVSAVAWYVALGKPSED
jgi:hypothetical protein